MATPSFATDLFSARIQGAKNGKKSAYNFRIIQYNIIITYYIQKEKWIFSFLGKNFRFLGAEKRLADFLVSVVSLCGKIDLCAYLEKIDLRYATVRSTTRL